MFSEEKLSPSKAKKQRIDIKSFYSKNLRVLNIKKNSISKPCFKMFIRRKSRARKVYSCQIFLSFKR